MSYQKGIHKVLMLVLAFAAVGAAFGRTDSSLRLRRLLKNMGGGGSNISTYSNVSSEDESFYSSLRESRRQFSQKLASELRDARLERDAAVRQRNAMEAAEMMKNWPKCSAMDSDGRLCLKPCPSRGDSYCNVHRKYVPLFERYFDALSSMESAFAPVDVSTVISSFLFIRPDMDSIVFELDRDALFKVVHVVRIGSSFAVADSLGKIAVIDDRRNYIDGDYVIGGKYVVCGVRQFGIAGLENTVTALRRITEREEERLRQKQEDLNRRNAEVVREILLGKYESITQELHSQIDEVFFDDPDPSARMAATIKLKAGVDACHSAFAAFDTGGSKKAAVELRRAWNEEYAALQSRIEIKRKADEAARIQWEKEHPEEMERRRLEKLAEERKASESKVAETRDKMDELRHLVERYKKECTRNGNAPTSLSVLRSMLRDRPNVPYRDAWGELFEYEACGELYAISSAGPDRKQRTEDDIVISNQGRQDDSPPSELVENPKTQMQKLSEEARAARERVKALPQANLEK